MSAPGGPAVKLDAKSWVGLIAALGAGLAGGFTGSSQWHQAQIETLGERLDEQRTEQFERCSAMMADQRRTAQSELEGVRGTFKDVLADMRDDCQADRETFASQLKLCRDDCYAYIERLERWLDQRHGIREGLRPKKPPKARPNGLQTR